MGQAAFAKTTARQESAKKTQSTLGENENFSGIPGDLSAFLANLVPREPLTGR